MPLPPGNGLSGHTLPTSVRFADSFSPRGEAQYVKKHLLCLIENVGANIVRPPTWRSNALFGKLLTGRTGTGEQCSPLQCAFLTVCQSIILLFIKRHTTNIPCLTFPDASTNVCTSDYILKKDCKYSTACGNSPFPGQMCAAHKIAPNGARSP